MELKNFIRESLNQICQGIKEAQESNIVTLEKHEGQPTLSPIAPKFHWGITAPNNAGERINFDIAVTITDDEKLNATGGVNLKIAKGGVDKQNSTKTENTHRINFSIPIFPHLLESKN